jgi:hypothetical protein
MPRQDDASFSDQGGSDCYLPSPRTCTYTFPGKEVRVTIAQAPIANLLYSADYQPINTPNIENIASGVTAKYRSSKTNVPAAVVDGDCRLEVPGANNLLTGVTGSAVFDSAMWMMNMDGFGVDSMGAPVKATRIRWVCCCACLCQIFWNLFVRGGH